MISWISAGGRTSSYEGQGQVAVEEQDTKGPAPLPMASARRAIGISFIESFWRAFGVEMQPFS